MSLIVNSNIDSVRLYQPSPKKVQAEPQSRLLHTTAAERPSYIKSDSDTLLDLAKKNPFNEPQSTIYDQPNQKMSAAISLYKTFANLERREEIQQLVGVDIYA